MYFAYSYPFTYSNLNNFIEKIESDVVMKNYCRRTPLCKTLAGNRVDVLTITEDHPNLNVNMNVHIGICRVVRSRKRTLLSRLEFILEKLCHHMCVMGYSNSC